MIPPKDQTLMALVKARDGLKAKVAQLAAHRLKADGLNLPALKRIKLPEMPDIQARLAKLKLPTNLGLPDRAASIARLKAAQTELARQVKRAGAHMPRSLGEVVPKAKEMAERIADAVPRRAPAEPLAGDGDDRAPRVVPPSVEAKPVAVSRVDRRAGRELAPPLVLRILPLLLAVVAGGVIHILATFVVPMLGSGSAWNRLLPLVPASNRMTILAPPSPASQPLPFLAPDMRYAICRFDLAIGPVQVTAVLPDAGWSLTLYSPQGDNFYAVPAQDLRRTELAFQIVSASDRLIQLSPGVRKADVDLSQVTSPAREGLIVIRAPIKGIAHQVEAERVLRTANCQSSRPN